MLAVGRLRVTRWAPLLLTLWCLLPATELIGMSLAFDAGRLLRGGHPASGWTAAVAWAPHIGRLGVAFLVAMLLHGGAGWWAESRTMVAAASGSPASARLRAAALHVALFGLFLLVTARLLLPGADPSWEPALGVLWPATAAAVAASWALILAPAGAWVSLARRRRGSIAAGLAIAAAAWIAGLMTQALWEPMADATLGLSRALLGLVAPVAASEPGTRHLGIGEFRVNIAPACSGYEGIGLLWAVLGSYLWICRRAYRFPQAFALLAIGTVLVWLANALRITALVLLGAYVSRDLALGGFHSQAGWIALNAVTLGVIVLSRRWDWVRRAEPGADAEPAEAAPGWTNPTAPYLAPLLVVVGTALATGAFTAAGAADAAYGLRVVAGFAALWAFRRSYRGQWGPLGRGEVAWAALAGVAVYALWMALEPPARGSTGPATLFAGWPGWAPAAWVAFKLVGSIALIPVVEELAFRGFAIRRLVSADFFELPLRHVPTWSLLVSSVLFGAMHDRWLAGTLAGLIYGLALRRRGSLWEPILAHAITNALIAATVLVGGAWSLW